MIKNYLLLLPFVFLISCGSDSPEQNAETAGPAVPVYKKERTTYVFSGSEFDSLAAKVFRALKTQNKEAYRKVLPTKKEIESIALAEVPVDRMEEAKIYLAQERMAETETANMLAEFTKALDRGKEFRINWSNINCTSFRIDSVEEDGRLLYNGEMGFSDGDREFFIKFGEAFRFSSGRVAFTNIAMPYEDLTDENLKKNEFYRESYIRRCLKDLKDKPGMAKMRLEKKTPEEFCACSFYTIAQQTYGEDQLKDTTQIYLQSGACP